LKRGVFITHYIALAPDSYSIWMAHPFSGVPTNSVVAIGSKKYYGNWHKLRQKKLTRVDVNGFERESNIRSDGQQLKGTIISKR
jgi:hypothetical protein